MIQGGFAPLTTNCGSSYTGPMYQGVTLKCSVSVGFSSMRRIIDTLRTADPNASLVVEIPSSRIVNRSSSRCLDAAEPDIDANGTRVQLWDCQYVGVKDNQQWVQVYVGTNGSGEGIYMLQNLRSGRCLDAAMDMIGSDGTPMQLWDCSGGSNQYWVKHFVGGDTEWISYASGRRLDADTNTIGSNGTTVHLWSSTGASNQRWYS